MTKLTIVYRPIGDLKPRTGNPRTHSKKQLDQIAASIRKFGFTNPVLIEGDDHIIAGHGRIEAAKMIGMTEVPTVRLADMTEADVRAYVIADNRLAELAGWDRTLLAIEFRYLDDLDLDFDLTITGFELPEIDIMMVELDAGADGKDDHADCMPAPTDGPAITRPGDVWIMGDHRLICGNGLEAETYRRLLGEERVSIGVQSGPPIGAQKGPR